MILMEEDNTPNSAIAKGHHALNAAMQPALDGLIKQIDEQIKTIPLDDLKKNPEQAKENILKLIKDKVGEIVAQVGPTVRNAIKNDVSVWEWLGGLGDMDDQIGTHVVYYPREQLEEGAQPIQQRWKNEGDWELTGEAYVTPLRAWTWIGGQFQPVGPAAVSWAANRLDIVGIGLDGAMYQPKSGGWRLI